MPASASDSLGPRVETTDSYTCIIVHKSYNTIHVYKAIELCLLVASYFFFFVEDIPINPTVAFQHRF